MVAQDQEFKITWIRFLTPCATFHPCLRGIFPLPLPAHVATVRHALPSASPPPTSLPRQIAARQVVPCGYGLIPTALRVLSVCQGVEPLVGT